MAWFRGASAGGPCSGAGLSRAGRAGPGGFQGGWKGAWAPAQPSTLLWSGRRGSPSRLSAEDPTSLGLCPEPHTPTRAMLSDGRHVSRDQGDQWPHPGRDLISRHPVGRQEPLCSGGPCHSGSSPEQEEQGPGMWRGCQWWPGSQDPGFQEAESPRPPHRGPFGRLAGACTMATSPLPSPPRGQPRPRDRRAGLQGRAGLRAWEGRGPTVGRRRPSLGVSGAPLPAPGTNNVIWTARCSPGTGRCLLQSSQHDLDHPHFTDARLREVNGPAQAHTAQRQRRATESEPRPPRPALVPPELLLQGILFRGTRLLPDLI